MVADEKNPGTLRYEEKPMYTTSNGCPVQDPESSQRVGQNGPLLLQDFHLIDLLAHFDRERIPERVVHAKGAGAYGEFEVTHDISDLVCAGHFRDVFIQPLTISLDLAGHAHRCWQEDQMCCTIFDRRGRKGLPRFCERSSRLFRQVLH